MIRIATLNTWKCDGDYVNRLEVLLRNIEKLQPHILLLQEAFQSKDNTYDTTRYIAEKMDCFYFSSQSRSKIRLLNQENIDSFSNVSVISSFPIINRYIVSLPSNDEDGGREAVTAEIAVNNKKILVMSVHLSHLRNGDDLRKQQLSHLLHQPFVKNEYDGIFIGGDFNATIDTLNLEELSQEMYYLEDTHKIKKNVGIDYTLSYKSFSVKIDHLLQLYYRNREKLEITESSIVFHEPDPNNGIKASDHNGVMIYVNL